MTLYKRGRIYWVEYQVDGVRYRQSTHAKSLAVAKAWVAQIETARRMPTFDEAVAVLKMFYKKPVEGLLPVGGVWEVYERMAKSIGRIPSKSTTRLRKYRVERFLTWLKKNRPTVKTIEAITGPIAAAYAEALADEGLKTKTRRNFLGDLSAVWKVLEKASTEVRNPWPNLAPSDTDGERGHAFTPEQEERVLAAAKKIGRDWFPICVIMRHTGLRYGDVARLTWGEIQDGVIRLAPHKTKRHGIAVAIPMTAPVAEAIGELKRRGDFLFPMHADVYGDSAALLRSGLRFREVLKAAGVSGKGYTIHSWRHTAATRLAAAGVEIETRKRILGHTVDATARRYDHDEHLGETRAALEAATAV